MRKNLRHRKSLEVKTTFKVEGLNLDNFVNTVKKRGIWLYNVKKYGNKSLYLSVNFHESRKFFAIAKELCYNVTKIRDSGKGYFLLSLYRSIGVVVGCLIIALTAIYASDVIFSFEFTGSASNCGWLAKEYLYSHGIKPFTKFSDIDLNVVEDGLLAELDCLSFVSVKKSGNRLVVDMALSREKPQTLKGDVYSLCSDCDGEIESIKVYRGTATVCEGDFVKAGDLLVDGVAVINDNAIKINVLASITLKCQQNFCYFAKEKGLESQAQIMAVQELGEKNVLSTTVSCKEVDGGYSYEVTAVYRRVLYAG